MSELNYQGTDIPVRDVLLKDSPTCTPYYRKISNSTSHDLLMDNDSMEAVDDDAEAIDNAIYYYASDEDFATLSDQELTELVAKETDAFVGSEEEL